MFYSRSTLKQILLFVLLIAPITIFTQNKYHPYQEMTDDLNRLVSTHSNIATIKSIGKTLENRDIWLVTIGGKDADNKHAMLIVGGVEADRIIGSELTLKFINFLLDGYGKVDSITEIVNYTTFYILPRVNPDASEEFFKKPTYARVLNSNPTDDDKDGLIDEDGYEDLNGDGYITMMRVKDDLGEWIPHPTDPRIMKKADISKGEKGMYKLFTEGIDNDKDEQWNEDELGGVDFNRNFPHNYQFFSKGAGVHQVSEIESRAVADFCFAHPNIAIVFTFASNDNLMNPWKKEQRQGQSPQEQRTQRRRSMMEDEEQAPRFITSVLDEDEPYYTFISKQYQEITKLKNAPPSTKGEGSFSEWAYYQFGRWSFAVNPWWIPDIEQKKDSTESDTTKIMPRGERNKNESDKMKFKTSEEKPDEYSDQIKALKWLDKNKIKDGFINWTKIQHKDFPDKEVEVGGFRPYVISNPPPDSINAIAEKQNLFIAWLSSKLPQVKITNIKIDRIEGKVFRLTANITNTGYFPTVSAIGDKVRWQRNIKVTLDMGKEQSLAGGKTKIVLEPIKGNGGSQEITWLIVSKAGESVTLTAESPMAGKDVQKIILK